ADPNVAAALTGLMRRAAFVKYLGSYPAAEPVEIDRVAAPVAPVSGGARPPRPADATPLGRAAGRAPALGGPTPAHGAGMGTTSSSSASGRTASPGYHSVR